MASKLQVINAGLLMVGAAPLTSLTDNTVTKKKALAVYDIARLEVNDLPIDWHFATARKQLAQRTETPDFGYDYMYNFPPGLRRVLAQVDVSGDEIEYEWRREVYLVGARKYDVMLTNQDSPVYIKYIVERSNEGTWPAWYARLVYLNLAYMLAEPLKKDKAKVADLFKIYELAKVEAEASNAIEIGKVSDKYVRLNKGNTDVVDAAEGFESTKSATILRVTE